MCNSSSQKSVFRGLSLIILASLLCTMPEASESTQQLQGGSPLKIGNRRTLFVDRFAIDALKGAASLFLHKPERKEVVIVHDKPWEGSTCGYHTVFKDNDLYRMYYRGSEYKKGEAGHPEFTCYAESTDGIDWKRPELGIVEFKGNAKNNIILKGLGAHNFTPFQDANPDCPPQSQYKALGRGTGPTVSTLYAFHSPDGIHWNLMQKEPVITKGAMDSQNLAFWDPVRKQYRCYLRDFRNGKRDIRTCTSSDFLNWTEPAWLSYPGAPDEHLYTNQIRPYARAPHLFIGFPTRYLPKRGSLVEPIFMTSRDGRTFHRWEEAVIRPGRNRERWHNRSNYAWWSLVETDSDLPGGGTELSLYTNERYYQGKGVKIRRYTYRPDGFVSIHASFAGGEAVTKPLVFKGGALHLNFSTSAAGSIRVELQTADGRAAAPFSLSKCPAIYGDAIDQKVTWGKNSDVGKLAGTPIRVRFVLKDADIFAMQFR